VRRRDLLRARAIRVDNRGQLDARQRRENPGMVLSKVPDADDRNPQGHDQPRRYDGTKNVSITPLRA